MLSLKDKSRIEAMIGQSFMYKTKVYKFTDMLEIGDQVIISTDQKALRINVPDITNFIKECMPADLEPSNNKAIALPIDSSVFSEVTKGLMTSFREIQDSNDDEQIIKSLKKAKGKSDVAKTLTSIAKLALDARRIKE